MILRKSQLHPRLDVETYRSWGHYDFFCDALDSECICDEVNSGVLDQILEADIKKLLGTAVDKKKHERLEMPEEVVLGHLLSEAEVRKEVQSATWYQNLKRADKLISYATNSDVVAPVGLFQLSILFTRV